MCFTVKEKSINGCPGWICTGDEIIFEKEKGVVIRNTACNPFYPLITTRFRIITGCFTDIGVDFINLASATPGIYKLEVVFEDLMYDEKKVIKKSEYFWLKEKEKEKVNDNEKKDQTKK